MTRFAIGTFNLYNLVLPNVTYYGNKRYSTKHFTEKVQWIGRQLDAMDSDIVGFQEVFHRDALVQAIARAEKYDNANVVVEGETGTGPVVGLLSRFDISESQSIRDFPDPARLQLEEGPMPVTSFSRPVLKARIQIPDGPEVTVFVAHLKSKRPDVRAGADEHDFHERAIGKARSLIRRASEAIALRVLVLGELLQTRKPALVIGDLNDAAGAVTTEIISGSPPWRALPYERKKQIWDVLLYNVKDIQARRSSRDVYYTHIYNGHYDALDHIFISQEFYNRNPERIGHVEYVRILNDHLRDDTLSHDRVRPWESDHAQAVATIHLKDH